MIDKEWCGHCNKYCLGQDHEAGMYIIYVAKTGEKVVRSVSDIDTIPALTKTHKGSIGCWDCGAPVSWSFETLEKVDIECSDCGSQMIIAQSCTTKISTTPNGAMVSRVSLFGIDDRQNCDVLPNGDLILFPGPDDPDFDPANHDPIGCTAMELFLKTVDHQSKARART